MSSLFLAPTEIVFGRGALNEVGRHAAMLGSKAALVMGLESAEKNGFSGRVRESLAASKVQVVCEVRVPPGPFARDADLIATAVVDQGADVLIALGGGSVLDAAKAAAVGTVLGPVGPLIGTNIPDVSVPRVVAVPTTPGTGAEVTRGSIIFDPTRKMKSGIRGKAIFPAVAIVDPELLGPLPLQAIRNATFDVFAHGIETSVARGASGLTRPYTDEANRLLAQCVPAVCRGSRDDRTMTQLSLASILAGIAVANASTCLPHRLEQAASSVAPAPLAHGAGLAAVYPAWLASLNEVSMSAVDVLAVRYGAGCAVGLVQSFRTGLNLELSLSQADLALGDAQRVVDALTGNVDNDPTPYSEDRALTIVLGALDASS